MKRIEKAELTGALRISECRVVNYNAVKGVYTLIMFEEPYKFLLNSRLDRDIIRMQPVPGKLYRYNKAKNTTRGYNFFKGNYHLRILTSPENKSLLAYNSQDLLYVKQWFGEKNGITKGIWEHYRIRFEYIRDTTQKPRITGEVVEIINGTHYVIGNSVTTGIKNCYLVINGRQQFFSPDGFPEDEWQLYSPRVDRVVNYTNKNLTNFGKGDTIYARCYVNSKIVIYYIKVGRTVDVVLGGMILKGRVLMNEQEPEVKYNRAYINVAQKDCFLWGNPIPGEAPKVCWFKPSGFAE